MGFVFYDTETTGLRKGFDQIVQFAAIHVDADLNELDRFELRCRLQPHVVPHPQALLSNRLSIERLTDPVLPSHYEMVREIRWRLSQWGPSIFIGYNSIRFDEEMLRHALFQCLFPAYLTSTPGCGRADAMHIVLAACAETEPCLVLPEDADGRRTFKLDAVARANGLDQGPAHDAIADTKATLALCRHVASQAPEVWSRFVRTANKAAVADIVASEPVFILTEFRRFEASHRLVSCLGAETGNPNGRLCWDLAIDPAEAAALPDEALATLVADLGGPVRRLRINAAPALTMAWDAPLDWTLDGSDEAVARAAWLAGDASFGMRVAGIQAARWAGREPPSHVELRLYEDGFPGGADEALMADFHEASKADRRDIIDRFGDARLQVFARRLLHMEHRSAFTEAERRAADLDLALRLLEDRSGPLTLPGARMAIDDLVVSGEFDVDGILAGYGAWLDARMAKVRAFAVDV